MDYRTAKEELLEIFPIWDELIPGRGRIHLIACGGTALTLLGYKESTRDVDLLVPNEREYKQLIRFLERAGYRKITSFGWKHSEDEAVYDLYPGKRVYVTELITSPLTKGGNRKIYEWNRIYLGVLNTVDLIISKMFRGTGVDREDCLTLVREERLDFNRLERRYRETAQYDVGEEKVMKNWGLLLSDIKRHGIPMGRKR